MANDLAPSPGSPPASPPAPPAATPPAATPPTGEAPPASPPAATPPAAADWRDGLEGEVKEFASRFTTPHDVVKSAYELRKANGSMTRVPGKDAKPEDVAKFRTAIGAGQKAEEYFPPKEGVEVSESDKAIQGKVADVLLKHHVPTAAAGELAAVVAELGESIDAENNRVALKARGDAEAALRKEWGGDYAGNLELAKRAQTEFGDANFKAFLDGTIINGQKLGDHPDIIRTFGQIGRRMGEGQFIGAVGSDQRQTLEGELAQLERDNPIGTPKYNQPHIQKRVREINVQLYGSDPIVGGQGRSV